MAYTYDADLEFLAECNDEQLKDLADILIEKGGFMGEITSSNEYKIYGRRYSKYWKLLAGELQKFGGNTGANFFRGGVGVKYDEILNDVLSNLKVDYKKSYLDKDAENLMFKELQNITLYGNTTDIIEEYISKLSEEDSKRLVETLKKFEELDDFKSKIFLSVYARLKF